MPLDAIRGSGFIPSDEGAALPVPGGKDDEGRSFAGVLADALGEVDSLQQRANQTVEAFATGAPLDVHDVMIALEQANTAMSMTLQVRNKLVEAYQEVMRMPV